MISKDNMTKTIANKGSQKTGALSEEFLGDIGNENIKSSKSDIGHVVAPNP